MDRSSKSVSVEKCDVIVLSDDSDTSLSNHVDDVDDTSPSNQRDDVDGEHELTSDEVQSGAAEPVRNEDGNCGEKATHGEHQNGGTEAPHGTDGKEQDGANEARDGAQYGVGGDEGLVRSKDENCVELKPSTDHSETNHGDDVHKPAIDVQQDGPQPAHGHAVVNEFQLTAIPPPAYCRRPSRARRSWSSRAADPPQGADHHDQVVSATRGGRGRGRRRNRVMGPRGVAPLSLRQFFDSGGRDYVEYLMKHIEAGVGLYFF